MVNLVNRNVFLNMGVDKFFDFDTENPDCQMAVNLLSIV